MWSVPNIHADLVEDTLSMVAMIQSLLLSLTWTRSFKTTSCFSPSWTGRPHSLKMMTRYLTERRRARGGSIDDVSCWTPCQSSNQKYLSLVSALISRFASSSGWRVAWSLKEYRWGSRDSTNNSRINTFCKHRSWMGNDIAYLRQSTPQCLYHQPHCRRYARKLWQVNS